MNNISDKPVSNPTILDWVGVAKKALAENEEVITALVNKLNAALVAKEEATSGACPSPTAGSSIACDLRDIVNQIEGHRNILLFLMRNLDL